MPTYSSKNHLLTPRNGRRKLRKPAHTPSSVLLWTSRTPSSSSSRAHSRALWQTVACPRPVSSTHRYPLASSVYSRTSDSVIRSTNGRSDASATVSSTSNRARPVSRPDTPATGGRSLAKVPCPRAWLSRRRGGSRGLACRIPFFPRILKHLVGLGLVVGQAPPRQAHPGQVLQAV